MSANAAIVLTLVLFVWFNRLERTGRGIVVVGVVFALIAGECIIYQSQNEIPEGLIHPVYKGQNFRLVDIVIPAALLARIIQRPRLTPGGAAWLAYLAWLAFAAIAGALDGNSMTLVTFHAKEIIYLGALYLAAGVDLNEYLRDDRLERFMRVLAGIAGLLLLLSLGHLRISANLPLFPLDDFGRMGTDAATIFTSCGTVGLAVALLAEDRRGGLLTSAVVLLATPVAAGQRAAFVALGVGLLVAVGVAAISKRPVRVTPTEGGLAVLAVLGALLLTAAPQALTNKPIKLPLESRLETTFGGGEEALTTNERVNQFHAVTPKIEQAPLFGHGLGYEYVYFQTGFKEFRKTDLTHNIVLDILVRTGFVGLALFALAMAGSLRSIGRAWAQPDPRVAAFGLGVAAFVLGLLAKGLAESIFEKYRLAAFLGLGIGTMLAAGAEYARQPVASFAERAAPLRRPLREPA